ncbi:bifunctional diguanylate cyclase/phosphodiesterase [Sphingomonas jaspsi]|uniref:bifunctional diguanylate cyclase/phosphodiesterase n=1 Tax=Sphingomonas jaspsi TaxID=392409 RepID=UPI0004B15EB3|nr:bifunctional diguanylate cyclase/phosphodiesterase [Sphingomonas jaspsi]
MAWDIRRPTTHTSGADRTINVSISKTILAVVLATICLAVGGALWAAHESDVVSVERQAQLAEHAMESSVDELALQQETVAVWDESAQQAVAVKPDVQWLEWNVGGYLNQLFGHDETYILDGYDKPIYADIKGQVVSPGRYGARHSEIGHLIESLRGRTVEPVGIHDRSTGRQLAHGSTVQTTSRSKHDSHLVEVGGRPAAVSAMLIVPATQGYVKPRGGWPILVSIRYLDSNFLDQLSARQLIADPRFSETDNPGPGEHSISLRTEWGASMGYLIWKPELPGTRILSRLWPFTALMILILAIYVTVIGRRLRQTAQDLASAEGEAARLAFHDGLTGLPNRAFFQKSLDEWIRRGHLDPVPFALVLLDVDDFKLINDSLGHDAGDAVLLAFADRVRSAIGPQDIMARLGGDEFALLLADYSDDQRLEAFCRRLLHRFDMPCVHGSQNIQVRASIGGAIRKAKDSAVTILKHADLALYESKATGKGVCRIYHPKMWNSLIGRREMMSAANQALAQDNIRPFYQPKVSLEDGRVLGFEALLRICPPDGEPIGPDVLAAAFEDSALASAISDKMIEQVLEDIVRWRRAGVDFGHVAINASAAELRRGDYAERLLARLDLMRIDPSLIQVEVTESVLLGRGAEHVERTFRTLANRGILLALDDFGTGFASLSHLKQFPVAIIKIDRTFIRDLQIDAGDGAIVDALIGLGQALKIDVVAEGIETGAQRDFLWALGCRLGQGYLFSEAVPASKVPPLVVPPSTADCGERAA